MAPRQTGLLLHSPRKAICTPIEATHPGKISSTMKPATFIPLGCRLRVEPPSSSTACAPLRACRPAIFSHSLSSRTPAFQVHGCHSPPSPRHMDFQTGGSVSGGKLISAMLSTLPDLLIYPPGSLRFSVLNAIQGCRSCYIALLMECKLVQLLYNLSV